MLSPVEDLESDSGSRRFLWVVAAGCVLALLIGLWLTFRPVEYAGNRPALVTPAAAGNVAATAATKESAPPPASRSDDRGASADVNPPPRTRRNSRVMPFSAATRSSRRTPMAAPYIPPPPANKPPPTIASTTPPTIAAATHAAAPAATPPAPAPIVRAPDSTNTTSASATRPAGMANPTQVGPSGPAQIRLPKPAPSRASGAVSVHLGSGQPEDGDVSSAAKGPVLRRRRPPAPASELSEDGTNLASENSPPAIPANGNAQATHAGTVHATSLGVMASHLMYSPVPVYPAAASASHVQGEVKLSADVDRDGNVASVRVISGPPLLRDAALDAVQRWRYRPYLSANGPIPTAAVAIVDFQLP